MRTLRLESSPLVLGLLAVQVPHEAIVGSWRVFEEYEPETRGDIREGLGTYRVVLESEVGDPKGLLERFSEGIEIAEELERAWIYVWTTPLHGKTFGVTLTEYQAPSGWRSNQREILRELNSRRSGLTFSGLGFERREWRLSNELPLKAALRLRTKYLAGDSATNAVINLHYEGHCSNTIHGTLFLFSKALEIARELLPGETDHAKARALPVQVQGNMRDSLHTLFGLANNRLNTRHAVKNKGPAVTLHPPLQGQELQEFLHDSDLVLRGVVCRQLGEGTVIPGGGSIPDDEPAK